MKKVFTYEEKKERAFLRVTRVIYDLWEEDSGVHTRILDWLIDDELTTIGTSINGGGHREHLVPCLAIIMKCKEMFNSGDSVESVAAMIKRNLKIAHITKKEARVIDVDLKYKSTMPPNWSFTTGDVKERLNLAKIEILD